MIKGIAADLHFHRWSAFAEATGGTGNSRLEGLLSELGRLADETAAAGGKVLVLAGDVFHVRGSVAPTVLNSVKDTLDGILTRHPGMDILVLAGNHDLEGKDSTRLGSAVTALERPGVRVINEPTVLYDMVLVPWFEDIEQLKGKLAELAESFTDAARARHDLILHAPIDGVIEGLPPHGLTPDWLAAALGFRRVLSGHYHHHKEFPGNVFSIGALAHHTWSDVGSKAGFLIVSDEEVTWRKSQLPAFIDLTTIDAGPEDIPFIVEHNYVRLKVESDKTKEVASAREELLAMGAKGVLMQATPKPPERAPGVAATVSAGASLEASIGEFVRGMGAEPERMKLVLKQALDCLSAADAVEAA